MKTYFVVIPDFKHAVIICTAAFCLFAFASKAYPHAIILGLLALFAETYLIGYKHGAKDTANVFMEIAKINE